MSQSNRPKWCYIKYIHTGLAFKREFHRVNTYNKLITEIKHDNVVYPSDISQIYFVEEDGTKCVIKSDDQQLPEITKLYISIKSSTTECSQDGNFLYIIYYSFSFSISLNIYTDQNWVETLRATQYSIDKDDSTCSICNDPIDTTSHQQIRAHFNNKSCMQHQQLYNYIQYVIYLYRVD